MAQAKSSALSSSNSVPPMKTETPTSTSLSSSTDYSEPNAMAIAPYVPPASLFQDFNLPFSSGDSSNGLWDFGGTDGGGIPFVSGAQLEGQMNAQSSMQNQPISNGIATESNGDQSNGSQMPTHIAKNNPFLNKLRR